jgi:hypothetical protein
MNAQLPVEGCYCQDCDEARLAAENAYWEQFRPSYARHVERKDRGIHHRCHVHRCVGVLRQV